ncbi:MAG: radical SAM protein [Candidatus Delongbacteria bacterium]|jgi:molybdenum cofactor biosynthesis enzyme MoaA|nr:radical SAM protein [Candidatus Delongbacteria bacterium]
MKPRLEKYAHLLLPLWEGYNGLKSLMLPYPASRGKYRSIPPKLMRAYNKRRFHGAKRLFCYNPFVNLFFNIAGEAIACCRSHDNVLGTYPEQSIKGIWFGKKAEAMREHMRHNDLSMGCAYCEKQIKAHRFQGLPSMRADAYPYTKKGMYPKIMELELSNACNLECVMCSGRESSKIRANREHLPPLVSPYDDNFIRQLEAFIPHLREMHFYGGEPFLIDIYYKIWDKVIALNPNIKMSAVTNGTIYNARTEQILLSTRFDLTVSVDSLNKERFEQIRKGADFDVVMQNIDKFNQLTDNHLTISHTPISLNWQDTPGIVQFCNDKQARLNLSFAERPSKYALWANHPDKIDEMLAYYDSIDFTHDKHNFAATYNIRVFNEWKEQLMYFRDKNRQILEQHGDYVSKEKEIENALVQRMNEVMSAVFSMQSDVDYSLNILREELLDKPSSPVKTESMHDVLTYLNDRDSITSEKTRKTLLDPEKFRKHLSALMREARFWEKYY